MINPATSWGMEPAAFRVSLLNISWEPKWPYLTSLEHAGLLSLRDWLDDLGVGVSFPVGSKTVYTAVTLATLVTLAAGDADYSQRD
jgi:hypothetical protein